MRKDGLTAPRGCKEIHGRMTRLAKIRKGVWCQGNSYIVYRVVGIVNKLALAVAIRL